MKPCNLLDNRSFYLSSLAWQTAIEKEVNGTNEVTIPLSDSTCLFILARFQQPLIVAPFQTFRLRATASTCNPGYQLPSLNRSDSGALDSVRTNQ